MPTHRLVPYRIKMWKKYNPDENWDLSDLSSESDNLNDNTIVDLFERFCDDYDYDTNDEYAKLTEMGKVFIFDRYRSTSNIIEGAIAGGQYGLGADHLDADQGDWTRNARGVNEAVIYPYYFILVLPQQNAEEAFLILEKISGTSIRAALERELKDWLATESNEEAFFDRFQQVATPNLIQELQNANRLVSLRFQKNRTARELHNNVSNTLTSIFRDTSTPAKHEIDIKPESGGSLASILNRDGISDVLFNEQTSSVTIDGEDYGEGSITLQEDGGSTRTFELFKDEAEMAEIIEPERDNIDLDHQGHPVPASLSPKAREFLNDIFDQFNRNTIPTTTIL